MIRADSNKLLMSAQGHGSIPNVLKIDNKVGLTLYKDVRYVDLSNNEVQEVDGSFCRNLEALTHLDLRNNRIKTISQHMRALMNLTVLRLDNNQLTVMPEAITSLRLLEELSL
jgi:adenylate cyclase